MTNIFCESCGRELEEDKAVWFELNFVTNEWYVPGECPPNESQGGFCFGSDCAKKIKVVKS